jgi:hypothetical protein
MQSYETFSLGKSIESNACYVFMKEILEFYEVPYEFEKTAQ